jgi:hypothetical protein
MESTNLRALEIVDAQFQALSDRIDALDLLSDKLQTSRERIAELDGEISQIKNDADSLERSKRISRLTSLNSAKELAAGDDSKIVAAIVVAKSQVLASGRAARGLIGSVIFQLSQARKMSATLLLETHFVTRRIPVRLSDLANNSRGVVELREIEDLLVRPLRGRDEELGALYALKAKFEPIRTAVLNQENLALELRSAEEPAAIPEPAATNLEPALA